MGSKLLKKFLSFSYGSIVGSGIAFFTTMVTTRVLQPEEFGKASMFILFVNIAMIIAVFGTDRAFVRFFYEEETIGRGALLYNCLKVSVTILVPLIAIVTIFRIELLNLLFSDYALTIFIALIISICSQVLYRFGTLVVRMQQKGHIYSFLEILNKLIILICVITFYFLLGNTYKILIYSTVITFIFLVIFLIYSQREFWNLKNIKSKKITHSKKDIFTFSYPLVFTAAIMWIFEGLDKFAIRHWADFNELGLYSAAFRIIGLLSIMKMAFTTFWTPVSYESYQNNPEDTSLYSNITRLVTFVMVVFGIIIIATRDFIIMLLGGGYQEASLMLSFLIFIPIMYTISETTVIGINFKKRMKWHLVIASIVCILNFIGNLLLVPKYGGVGASISTGIAYILFFTLRTFISLYYYKVDYGLKKIFISIVILVIYAGYTLSPSSLINEKLLGLIAIVAVIITYSADIRRIWILKIKKQS